MQVGLYGKLPSHGDFLRRRTSDAFVARWDAWLQDCLSASRTALGDNWLNLYLTSPAWRFAAAPGVFGPASVVGLMAPSVDRVGRYFPLAIVAELSGEIRMAAAITSTAFFDAAERLVIETLESEYVDFEEFDRQVSQLAATLPPAALVDDAQRSGLATILEASPQGAWRLPLPSVDGLTGTFAEMAIDRVATLYPPMTLWWTDGSAAVEPSCLVLRDLPHPDSFAALLNGVWAHQHWGRVGSAPDRAPTLDDLLIAEPPLKLRSAAASDAGRVRAVNQDSFLEKPEAGLWVVADGLGGHSGGEQASRMVCDALADLMPSGSLEGAVADVRRRLQQVNDHLLFSAAGPLLSDRSGSTVVALLVRGRRCAVLWAGDSRIYRLRAGRLLQLTQDHSPSINPSGGHDSHTVTRAVGAQADLQVDLHTDHVLPGDRFLLCSDGLTRCVPEPQLLALMEVTDLRAAVDRLVAATLSAGAPDNVTALLVEGGEYA